MVDCGGMASAIQGNLTDRKIIVKLEIFINAIKVSVNLSKESSKTRDSHSKIRNKTS